MLSSKNITYVGLALLVAYAYGIVTAQYKIFPYDIVREIKQFITSDTNAIAAKKNENDSQKISYHVKRKSFLEEHVREVNVVMLGDSLTDNAEWTDLFPSQDISNHGISGDTTADILSRIDLVHKAKPEKVFIMIGINDLIKSKSIDEIQHNYKKIVDDLIENNINVYIQSTLLVGNKLYHLNKNAIDLNKKVIDLNKILENLAHKNELVTYVDLNEFLGNDLYLSEKYSFGGLQLNGKGYKVWRDIISSHLL